MKAKHRQIFDMPQPSGGLPLIHVRNSLNTYKDAYNLKPGSGVKAAASLYFMTVPLAFNDAMWAKYKFGEATKVTDTSTKAPAVLNVFAKPPNGSDVLNVEGMVPVPADASITALQERGTVFLLCNNAFNFWVRDLATATDGKEDTIRKELLANMLPEIELVPAMVIAFNLAQEHGISYMYLA